MKNHPFIIKNLLFFYLCHPKNFFSHNGAPPKFFFFILPLNPSIGFIFEIQPFKVIRLPYLFGKKKKNLLVVGPTEPNIKWAFFLIISPYLFPNSFESSTTSAYFIFWWRHKRSSTKTCPLCHLIVNQETNPSSPPDHIPNKIFQDCFKHDSRQENWSQKSSKQIPSRLKPSKEIK